MKARYYLAVAALIIAICTVLIIFYPSPTLKPNTAGYSTTTTQSVSLAWPTNVQSAIGAQNYGVLASSGAQTSLPIASIAKVVTALSVLKQKPLVLNDQGPILTLTDADVGYYNSYAAQDGSVVKVVAGEQISEYQALQAMLLPSANNMADTLAVWAFGSMDAYTTYANQTVAAMGLSQTHLADASGFSSLSVSSASDLVSLGLAALKDPVLAQIVSQTSAQIPVAGTVSNINWLLGSDGVVGIKTGNTDQAGGCFLFATNRTISGQTVLEVGTILGAPDLSQAISSAKPLIDSADQGFYLISSVKKVGKDVGSYQVPWAGKVNAVAKNNISLLIWRGTKATITASLNPVKSPKPASTVVGSLSITSGSQTAQTNLVLESSIHKPSRIWQLLHLF